MGNLNCCDRAGCCTPKNEAKRLVIDFLYLDLSLCGRCQGAEKNLDKAIKEVSAVLKAAGYDVFVNKVNIVSEELAIQYKFLSSPTIRINGEDITLEVKESLCRECGDLCGDTVECRVFTYNGVDYTEPPKEMIINGILKAVYGGSQPLSNKKETYRLPANLAVFFKGLKRET
jgi:hypothetical protein